MHVSDSFNSRTLGRVRPLLHFQTRGLSSRFNSRTLGRVRLCATALYICSAVFQFTHPGKGATCRLCLASICEEVSIHAPWEGCDLSVESVRYLIEFQFTHPGKGATWLPLHYPRGHSRFNSRTLGRVRLKILDFNLLCPTFQFTHPGKGATAMPANRGLLFVVSIHAPWEGCDRHVDL